MVHTRNKFVHHYRVINVCLKNEQLLTPPAYQTTPPAVYLTNKPPPADSGLALSLLDDSGSLELLGSCIPGHQPNRGRRRQDNAQVCAALCGATQVNC